MKYVELEIEGVWLIEHSLFGDARGHLERVYDQESRRKRGIDTEVEHALISKNPKTGTLRGFHFQVSPFLEAKTISCTSGAIYDVVVDLRVDSKTYCKWVGVELDEEKAHSLHVPKGCANAWLTLAPETTLHYFMAEQYSPEHSRGFRFDDPAFEVDWPNTPAVIAERDLSWPAFNRLFDGIQL